MIWAVTILNVFGSIIDLITMKVWTLQEIEHPGLFYMVYKSIEEIIMYALVLILLRNLLELN